MISPINGSGSISTGSAAPRKDRPTYIVVDVPIGVGKTTLVRRLSEHFSARLLLEIVEENPFLSDFYKDPEKFAFQTQCP